MRHHKIRTSLALFCLLPCGCTNPPDGPRMQCAPTQAVVRPDEATQLKAPFSAAGGAVDVSHPPPLSRTDAWIKAMVDLAETGGPFKEKIPCDHDPSETDCYCWCYYTRDLDDGHVLPLFIDAGYSALPELMRHVRDDRPTGWTFNYPVSSAWDAEPKMVGTVACFLIEAILRENPYFTYSCRFVHHSPAGMSWMEAEKHALYQAASAYEQWFEECFDERTSSVTCPPEQLPVVKWRYSLELMFGKTVVASRTGRLGYMLLLSNGSWLSFFLSREDEDRIDWRYGFSAPSRDEIARLGPLQNTSDEDGLAPEIAKTHGKTLKRIGGAYTVRPVFDDGSTLWAEANYESGDNVGYMCVRWGPG